MTERQSTRMSKLKNGGLDQYGAEPFEQQQFGTAGVEGVNNDLVYCTAWHKAIVCTFTWLCTPTGPLNTV